MFNFHSAYYFSVQYFLTAFLTAGKKHKLTESTCSCAIENTKDKIYFMWIQAEIWNCH